MKISTKFYWFYKATLSTAAPYYNQHDVTKVVKQRSTQIKFSVDVARKISDITKWKRRVPLHERRCHCVMGFNFLPHFGFWFSEQIDERKRVMWSMKGNKIRNLPWNHLRNQWSWFFFPPTIFSIFSSFGCFLFYIFATYYSYITKFQKPPYYFL